MQHRTAPRTVYARLKAIAARLMRPGLVELTGRVDDLQRRLDDLRQAQDAANASLSQEVARLVAYVNKHRDHSEELGFWRWLIKTEPGRASLFAPFEEAFGLWQRDRLRELARVLNLAPGAAPDQRAEASLRVDPASDAPSDGALDAALDAWCLTQRVVEIGGGPFPAVAAAAGWKQAVAVDPLARSYVEESLVPRTTASIVHLASSGEDVPLPACAADLAIVENALDHVSNPAAVLQEVLRLLAPGGRLWLLVDLSDYTDAMHPHAFNVARVRQLLTNTGFEIVHDRTSDHHSHPKAYGEYRALARKPAPQDPAPLPRTDLQKQSIPSSPIGTIEVKTGPIASTH